MTLSRRTFVDFLRDRPCLEEIDGFRDMRVEEGLWREEDQADFLVYKDRLERGKEVPARTTLRRAWIYQSGRKPKKKKDWQE